MSEILDLLKQAGAIITNSHIIGTSGKHLNAYVNKDAIYPHTELASRIGKMFAEKVAGLEVDVVVGPALGGIILSQWTAHHLSGLENKEVLGVYTEKTPDGGQAFTRGYDKFITGKKILVTEDITNTGGSAKKAMEAVKAAGGEVAAVAVIVNRNPDEVNANYFGVPFYPLAEIKMDAFEEADCPMCKSGMPINTTVGHGKKYLAAKQG